MDAVQAAARQACRAWFTNGAMGQVMSDLADQLARIDQGEAHGTYGKARGSTDGQAPRHGAGHSGCIAATATGGLCQSWAAQARD